MSDLRLDSNLFCCYRPTFLMIPSHGGLQCPNWGWNLGIPPCVHVVGTTSQCEEVECEGKNHPGFGAQPSEFSSWVFKPAACETMNTLLDVHLTIFIWKIPRETEHFLEKKIIQWGQDLRCVCLWACTCVCMCVCVCTALWQCWETDHAESWSLPISLAHS